MEKQEKYKGFLLKVGYLAAIAVIVLVFVKYLLSPLTPFLLALAVTALLRPIAKKTAQHLKLKGSAVAIIFSLLAYVLVAGLLVAILIGVISAVISWASGLPAFFTGTISPWIEEKGNELLALVIRFDPELQSTVDQLLPDAVGALSSSVMNFSMRIVTWASNVGSKLPGIMLGVVICVIATVFLSADFENVTESIKGMLPPKGREIVNTGRRALKSIIGNYVKSYSIILLITFGEICLGLLIIGFENAPVIALIIAIFDILPIVGSGMVLLPWTIITFIQGNYAHGVGLAILYVVVIVVRQVLEPKIVGKQVGLHPLMTLFCMWMGLKLAGGVGMFAFPITFLIIKELKAEGIIGVSEKVPTDHQLESVKGEDDKI